MGDVIRFPRHSPESSPVEPLWREVAGEQLRARRRQREERLVDVAERAGVSPQYLSEVERGLKDPSSELLAAISGALGLSLGDLSSRVARSVPRGPLCLAA
jgi:transcriptional regulator with XRE-family HTH domain